MPCASFEDRLIDYAGLSAAERRTVDAHLAGCAACRDYLQVLTQLDAALVTLYAGAQPSPAFDLRVRACLRKPSPVPELLDLIGSAAILALFAVLAPLLVAYLPAVNLPPEFGAFAAWTGAALAVLTAAWTCARCFTDLKH